MIKIKLKPIVEGDARGTLLISSKPLSFLYGIDINTGIVTDMENDLYGKCITNKIIFIPKSKGSSVGCYHIYKLKKMKKAPACILVKEPDEIILTGCVISNIPLYVVNDIPIKYNGRSVEINAREKCLIIRDC